MVAKGLNLQKKNLQKKSMKKNNYGNKRVNITETLCLRRVGLVVIGVWVSRTRGVRLVRLIGPLHRLIDRMVFAMRKFEISQNLK